jgi:hypothetical protein
LLNLRKAGYFSDEHFLEVKMRHVFFGLLSALYILQPGASLASDIALCKKAKNPSACRCAVQNGGWVEAQGNQVRWRSARRNSAGHMAFMACSAKAGGP